MNGGLEQYIVDSKGKKTGVLLSLPEHLLMKETLQERWRGRLELATIG